ncbi:hypothetical protein HPB52_024071 [Rhipicephalus sanguineus]|uniref:Uncharacterized protein n=1 Tax=Rhipicephalus sanguineus TaxID=34632 RepID=A0A9D4Q8F6_RHISA|nr:hypothetical protein HPB52_024071 [Rhipicephalus sanguineus]
MSAVVGPSERRRSGETIHVSAACNNNHPTINGGWYPMQNCRANGDTPAHRPMMGDQDDSDTGGFEDCRKN